MQKTTKIFRFSIRDVGHVGRQQLQTQVGLATKADTLQIVGFDQRQVKLDFVLLAAGERLKLDETKLAAIIQCRTAATPKGYVVAKNINHAHQQLDKYFLNAEEQQVEVMYYN